MANRSDDNKAPGDATVGAEARKQARVFKVPNPANPDVSAIVSYMDPVRKRVWFKVPSKRATTAPTGIAGYTTITEGDVTDVHRARAAALASNDALLHSKLAESIFLEACRLRGLQPSELLPKKRSTFNTEPNRAKVLSKDEADLRYRTFEKTRHHKIALVCSQEDRCILQQKRSLHQRRMYKSALSAGFKTNLEKEKEFMLRRQDARAKYEAVLEEENYRILEAQSEAMSKLAMTKNRYKRIDRVKMALQQVRRERGEAKKVRSAAHAKHREQREREERQALVDARLRKEAAVQARLDNKTKDWSARREKELKVKEAIAERHAAQKLRNEQARKKLVDGLAAKRVHIEEQLVKKQRRMEEQQQQRKIEALNKAAKAERIRSSKMYEKQKIIHKLNDDWARMELMKEFKEAVDEERRNIKRLQKIANDEWKKNNPVERDISPGAGHYNLKSTLSTRGGTWGRFKPKSEWDWIEYHGKQTPGPSDYGRVGSSLKLNGGVISKFKPMSDVDWKIKRAKAIPGPGAYEPRDVSSTAGATFGEFTPKTTIEILQDRAKAIPGPGQYDKMMPRARKKLEKLAPQFRVPDKHLSYIDKEMQKHSPRPRSRSRVGSNSS